MAGPNTQNQNAGKGAQDVSQASQSGETVTVACKLPGGLLLRNFEMVPSREPVPGGGYRDTQTARELPERVLINGFSHPQNKAPHCSIVGGYALTRGVSKEFWERWLAFNKSSDMVKNNLIFAHTSGDRVEAQATEQTEIQSGLERLDPAKLPKGLEKADRKAA